MFRGWWDLVDIVFTLNVLSRTPLQPRGPHVSHNPLLPCHSLGRFQHRELEWGLVTRSWWVSAPSWADVISFGISELIIKVLSGNRVCKMLGSVSENEKSNVWSVPERDLNASDIALTSFQHITGEKNSWGCFHAMVSMTIWSRLPYSYLMVHSVLPVHRDHLVSVTLLHQPFCVPICSSNKEEQCCIRFDNVTTGF